MNAGEGTLQLYWNTGITTNYTILFKQCYYQIKSNYMPHTEYFWESLRWAQSKSWTYISVCTHKNTSKETKLIVWFGSVFQTFVWKLVKNIFIEIYDNSSYVPQSRAASIVFKKRLETSRSAKRTRYRRPPACPGTVGALLPFLSEVTELFCKVEQKFLNSRGLAFGFVMR